MILPIIFSSSFFFFFFSVPGGIQGTSYFYFHRSQPAYYQNFGGPHPLVPTFQNFPSYFEQRPQTPSSPVGISASSSSGLTTGPRPGFYGGGDHHQSSGFQLLSSQSQLIDSNGDKVISGINYDVFPSVSSSISTPVKIVDDASTNNGAGKEQLPPNYQVSINQPSASLFSGTQISPKLSSKNENNNKTPLPWSYAYEIQNFGGIPSFSYVQVNGQGNKILDSIVLSPRPAPRDRGTGQGGVKVENGGGGGDRPKRRRMSGFSRKSRIPKITLRSTALDDSKVTTGGPLDFQFSREGSSVSNVIVKPPTISPSTSTAGSTSSHVKRVPFEAIYEYEEIDNNYDDEYYEDYFDPHNNHNETQSEPANNTTTTTTTTTTISPLPTSTSTVKEDRQILTVTKSLSRVALSSTTSKPNSTSPEKFMRRRRPIVTSITTTTTTTTTTSTTPKPRFSSTSSPKPSINEDDNVITEEEEDAEIVPVATTYRPSRRGSYRFLNLGGQLRAGGGQNLSTSSNSITAIPVKTKNSVTEKPKVVVESSSSKTEDDDDDDNDDTNSLSSSTTASSHKSEVILTKPAQNATDDYVEYEYYYADEDELGQVNGTVVGVVKSSSTNNDDDEGVKDNSDSSLKNTKSLKEETVPVKSNSGEYSEVDTNTIAKSKITISQNSIPQSNSSVSEGAGKTGNSTGNIEEDEYYYVEEEDENGDDDAETDHDVNLDNEKQSPAVNSTTTTTTTTTTAKSVKSPPAAITITNVTNISKSHKDNEGGQHHVKVEHHSRVTVTSESSVTYIRRTTSNSKINYATTTSKAHLTEPEAKNLIFSLLTTTTEGPVDTQSPDPEPETTTTASTSSESESQPPTTYKPKINILTFLRRHQSSSTVPSEAKNSNSSKSEQGSSSSVSSSSSQTVKSQSQSIVQRQRQRSQQQRQRIINQTTTTSTTTSTTTDAPQETATSNIITSTISQLVPNENENETTPEPPSPTRTSRLGPSQVLGNNRRVRVVVRTKMKKTPTA